VSQGRERRRRSGMRIFSVRFHRHPPFGFMIWRDTSTIQLLRLQSRSNSNWSPAKWKLGLLFFSEIRFLISFLPSRPNFHFAELRSQIINRKSQFVSGMASNWSSTSTSWPSRRTVRFTVSPIACRSRMRKRSSEVRHLLALHGDDQIAQRDRGLLGRAVGRDLAGPAPLRDPAGGPGGPRAVVIPSGAPGHRLARMTSGTIRLIVSMGRATRCPHRPGRTEDPTVVMPITASGAVEQRAARVARVQRRVRLDHAPEGRVGNALDLPAQTADDAGRSSSDRSRRDCPRRTPADRPADRWECRSGSAPAGCARRLDLQHGNILIRVGADPLRLPDGLVPERNLDRWAVLDHV